MKLRDARWRVALLVVATTLAGSAAAAQACPAPLLKRPLVRLSVRIEGCDYLAALAEQQHVRSADCVVIRAAVRNDPNSRVHALSRMLADSLRPIFAHEFGFLAWTTAPDSGEWAATVVLNQPQQGAHGDLRVALRSPGGVDTTSEAFRFELFKEIERLYGEPETPAALSAVRTRWTASIRTLLVDRGGFNRGKLVQSVFRTIPIAELTPAQAAWHLDGSVMKARLPLRDTDIHVKPSERPTFEWQVKKVVRGLEEDEAVVRLGACTGKAGYSCTMLHFQYGAASYNEDRIPEFFAPTPVLHAPIALHVLKYLPAPDSCALQGVIPR